MRNIVSVWYGFRSEEFTFGRQGKHGLRRLILRLVTTPTCYVEFWYVFSLFIFKESRRFRVDLSSSNNNICLFNRTHSSFWLAELARFGLHIISQAFTFFIFLCFLLADVWHSLTLFLLRLYKCCILFESVLELILNNGLVLDSLREKLGLVLAIVIYETVFVLRYKCVRTLLVLINQPLFTQ